MQTGRTITTITVVMSIAACTSAESSSPDGTVPEVSGSTTTIDATTDATADVAADRSSGIVHVVGDSVTAMHADTFVSGLADCGWEADLHSVSARRIGQAYEWNGRWVSSGVDEVRRILLADDPETWLFQLGSNDLQDLRSIDEARELIGDVLTLIDETDRVLWITVLWPGYDAAAAMFNEALGTTPGVEVVDWNAVGDDHLAAGPHPTDDGAELLVQLSCEALGDPLRDDASSTS